jgi:antitoxin CptB
MKEVELAKLRWQCRRGCKELDLLLTHYLENHYPAAPEPQKAYFHYLLTLDDDALLRHWPRHAKTLSIHQ